ncbi:MAG: YdcF family protein [Eubacteriales bacterium]|nr:YdcF family protein [Eubacteriales bacterium]
MKKINHFFLFLVIILLVSAVGTWFLTVDRWLVRVDEPRESDVVVVLLGSIPDRIIEAADLYHQDYAEKIVMVATHKQGYDVLLARGVDVPLEETLNAEIARQLDVPPEAIVIIPGDSRSTQDEAVVLRDYLATHSEIDSLILVTSTYHSGRAAVILEKAFETLERPIILTSVPTQYDDFSTSHWWADRNQFKYVIMETLKYVHFYLIEQFELGKQA